ncbi:hypothetical protein RFI_34637, partial [Reticulomyxa filosa]
MNKIEREEVLQKADTFGVIVSEDKDNFNNQSKIHQIETQHFILENTAKDQNKDTAAKEDRKENEGKLKNVKNKGFGPGINLQGYCTNKEGCIASKGDRLVWVNQGFEDISITPIKTCYMCPSCEKPTVASVIRVKFFNSEYSSDGSLHVTGLSYKLKANKIVQHATSLEDLINRSKNAMKSQEILNLVEELERCSITVAKPQE